MTGLRDKNRIFIVVGIVASNGLITRAIAESVGCGYSVHRNL